MTAISVENVSKLYQIGTRAPNSLRDLLAGAFRGPGGSHSEDLWALKDVSLTVNEGDTLGIIGRNGAGKSTLLKILSRITKPTSGRAEIRGRVGSLLEVGTGFHNELTGRENIYLNGAILGMKRVEIDKKFDEIVAFSELERFLDTPVKHYSSGMYMRLGFSIAAHLELEVLIVDEVLAVGDMNFQNKCIGRMDEVSRSGRTVLFVSHNVGSLSQICNKGVLLNGGRLVFSGGIHDAVNEYLKLGGGEATVAPALNSDADMQIVEASVTDMDGHPANEFAHYDAFWVSMKLRARHIPRSAMLCVALLNKYKRRVFTEHRSIEEALSGKTGDFRLTYKIPGEFIAPNSYSFLLQIFFPDGKIEQELFDVCPFTVIDAGSDMAAYQDHGYVQAKGEWQVIEE